MPPPSSGSASPHYPRLEKGTFGVPTSTAMHSCRYKGQSLLKTPTCGQGEAPVYTLRLVVGALSHFTSDSHTLQWALLVSQQ